MSKIKFYYHHVLSVLMKFEAEKNLEKMVGSNSWLHPSSKISV